MIRVSVVLAVSLLLAGCNPPIEHATPSGRPEATIHAPVDKAKAAFVGSMVNSGYAIKSDTPLSVVAEKVSTHPAAALLASNYDSRVMARITATFIAIGPDTRVVADMALVTNPGSAFEKPLDMRNGQDSARVQVMLDAIAASKGAVPSQL